jgi:benzoyl-CoA reductase subunit B
MSVLVDERPDETIIGRGNRDGARLFRSWFQRLTEAPERGEKAAYVFVMGSLTELLAVFDLHTVFPEINSLQTAVRGVADDYIAEAEEHGYSPDICAYVKADFTTHMRGGEHPMGTIPPPSMAVFTNACSTYIKWAEIWERLYDMPAISFDVPAPRAAGYLEGRRDEDYRNDLAYVEQQIRELIVTCEEVSGKAFDIDRLRENLGHANVQMAAWTRVHELNQSVPALYNAITDGTVFLGVANAFKGHAQGARYFEALVEELEHKAEIGFAALPDEAYRLVFIGVPCYALFRRFNEMFEDRGGVFVVSAYTSFASGATDMGFQYDLRRPIESLAEGLLRTCQGAMDGIYHTDEWTRQRLAPYAIDGVVYHPIKSCRTISTGLADSRRVLTDECGVLSLFVESDMLDSRVVSEAQMRNRIDAYFEGLESRRIIAGG